MIVCFLSFLCGSNLPPQRRSTVGPSSSSNVLREVQDARRLSISTANISQTPEGPLSEFQFPSRPLGREPVSPNITKVEEACRKLEMDASSAWNIFKRLGWAKLVSDEKNPGEHKYELTSNGLLKMAECLEQLAGVPQSIRRRTIGIIVTSIIAAVGPVYLSFNRLDVPYTLSVAIASMVLSMVASAGDFVRAGTVDHAQKAKLEEVANVFSVCRKLKRNYEASERLDDSKLPDDLAALGEQERWILQEQTWPPEAVLRFGVREKILRANEEGEFVFSRPRVTALMSELDTAHKRWSRFRDVIRWVSLVVGVLAPCINAAWCVLFGYDAMVSSVDRHPITDNTTNATTPTNHVDSKISDAFFTMNIINPIATSLLFLMKIFSFWIAQIIEAYDEDDSILKQLISCLGQHSETTSGEVFEELTARSSRHHVLPPEGNSA